MTKVSVGNFFRCDVCKSILRSADLPCLCDGEPERSNQTDGGVGTELTKIIPEFLANDECKCKDYAAKMDRWGVEGCEQRFDEIVNHLITQSKKHAIAKYFETVSRIIAERWVRQAIEKAKDVDAVEASDEADGKDQSDSWEYTADNADEQGSPARYSAVWVYWAGGAAGEELRYSMRSAQENLADLKNIVLCGDMPDWYHGDAIPSPKWTKRQNKRKFGTAAWAKWVDSIIKLQKIIDDPNVTDNFLWMYDDTFIVNRTTIHGLIEPRASGRIRANEKGNLWRKARARTAKELNAAGLPNWDYSTHCPIVFNKDRLRETIKRFRPDINPRVIESLYCNHWHRSPRGCRNFFHYRKKPMQDWCIPTWAKIINVGGFNHRVMQLIPPMFPEPCSVEQVTAAIMQVREQTP